MNKNTYLSAEAPSTRYQGSKRRVLPWIWKNLRKLEFDTVLDAFGGTGSVSYMMKAMGKTVTFNDILASNHQTGIALIENSSVELTNEDVSFLLQDRNGVRGDFIERTFKGVYYTNSENKWLDNIIFNISALKELYKGKKLRTKRALAYHSLFQACLRKRPFNLFHRKNLYLRLAKVERSFSNKTTWDKAFGKMFTEFVAETSGKVFGNSCRNSVLCEDIFNIDSGNYDLVYFDPPYMRRGEPAPKNYFALYHFLEGLVDYANWSERVDWSVKHYPMKPSSNLWLAGSVEENFKKLFQQFKDSIIVLSYGDPGTPSIYKIKKLLKEYKSQVQVRRKRYTYSLNRNNGKGLHEALIIGT